MRGILPSKLGERTDLPPIPEFSGVDQTPRNNSFQQWLEQFEMVAELAQWPETISSWPYMYVFEDQPRHIFVYAVKNRNTTTKHWSKQCLKDLPQYEYKPWSAVPSMRGSKAGRSPSIHMPKSCSACFKGLIPMQYTWEHRCTGDVPGCVEQSVRWWSHPRDKKEDCILGRSVLLGTMAEGPF